MSVMRRWIECVRRVTQCLGDPWPPSLPNRALTLGVLDLMMVPESRNSESSTRIPYPVCTQQIADPLVES